MKTETIIFLAPLLFAALASEENHQDLVQEGVSLVEKGLKIYPDINLHFQLPTHDDLTRIETLLREHVPRYVERFLKEIHSRAKNIVTMKNSTLDAMNFMPNNPTTDQPDAKSVKRGLVSAIDNMLSEMDKGLGSLEFEMDDIARTTLGDVYFYVKSMITSNLHGLRESPDNCGFNHPVLTKTFDILKSSEEETVKKVTNIILGMPGLDTKYIRPQLNKLRSSLPDMEESVFQFLVKLGEWVNDVLNAGLLPLKKPFTEIRGEILEIIGSTKDRIVPKLQEHLENLDNRKETLGFVTDMFTTVVKKYFGQF